MEFQRNSVVGRTIVRIVRPQKSSAEYDEFCRVFVELDTGDFLEIGEDPESTALRSSTEMADGSYQVFGGEQGDSLAGETIKDILVKKRGPSRVWVPLESGRVFWVADEESGTIIETALTPELSEPDFGYSREDLRSYWDR